MKFFRSTVRPRRVRFVTGPAVMTLCLFVSAIASPSAQTITATTGAVNGIVTDSTKAVVPGVTVSLSGPSLLALQTTLTDQTGTYRFSAVPPGDHTLTFELAGFSDDRPRRDPRRPRLHGDGQRRDEPGRRQRPRHGQRRSPVVDITSTAVTTPFDSRKARQPAWRPRHLYRSREHAGRGDVEDGRGRQPCALPAGVHRVRPSGDHRHEPQRGRRHSGRRRQRRRATTTFPTTRRSRKSRSRPLVSRPRCRCRARWASTSASPAAMRITAPSTQTFQNEAIAGDQYRRRPDRVGRGRWTGSRRARREPAAEIS